MGWWGRKLLRQMAFSFRAGTCGMQLATICSLFLLNIAAQPIVIDREFSRWTDNADLRAALGLAPNREIARNVILFIGDGMGPNTVTAARIYRAGETSNLIWEKFPHMAAIKTYSADKQVSDSAATANAMFTGVKNNYQVLGLDSNVKMGDCGGSKDPKHHLFSIASQAQEKGKATGFVTTTRVTGATPAALYARSAHREWECDSALPENAKNCKPISNQLVEDLPGKYFNVIMGGGAQVLRADASSLPGNPIDDGCCRREDGRDLIAEWAELKASKNLKLALPNDTKTLLAVDTAKTDYLFGIFSNSHMPFDYMRDKSENGMPSLEQMTTTAIMLLAKYTSGFFLMVEGGLIDKGHHAGKARVALHEVLSLNDAVNSTVTLLENLGIKEETLVIVTSDHAHTLTLSGYPERGSDIFGIADKSLVDGKPYTTLSYANSVKENFHFTVVDGTVVREDPSAEDTTSFDYHVVAPVVVDMNTHGGSDVSVYATGPHAYLFHTLHENTYVATVISFASRFGQFSRANHLYSRSSSELPSRALLFVGLSFMMSM